MARSTGPLLAAGGITWANNVLLGDREEDLFTATARIGIASGLAAGILFGIEKFSDELATVMSWAVLVTVLFVPLGREPTPLERIFNLTGMSR